MRAVKAKRLRAFVKKTFQAMPEKEYEYEKINTQFGNRYVMRLIGSCQRKVYQGLKKETQGLALA